MTYEILKNRIKELETRLAEKEAQEALHASQSEKIFAIQEAITRSLIRQESLQTLYSTIYSTLVDVLNIKNFFIAVIDKKNETLVFPFFMDEKDKSLTIDKIFDSHSNPSLSMRVIESQNSLFVTREDINQQNIHIIGSVPESWIGVPLKTKSEIIGLMAVQDYNDPLKFSENDVKMMEAIADFIAIAVEMKTNEAALNESRTKYKTILDNIVEGYYEVDINGNMIDCNEALCSILGYSSGELIGMNNREFIDESSWKNIYNIYNEVYRTGGIQKGIEWLCKTKTGEKKYVETSVVASKNKEGEPITFRGLASDVTQRKKAEEEKNHLEKRLFTAKRMESIGTLAGGIAHNFNNLLMAIKGYSELIRLGLEPDTRHYKMLMKIEKQVDNGSKLTSQLLGYARGGMYEVKDLNLNMLIKNTANTFQMARKDVSVKFELSNDIKKIKADYSQLEQVIMNLCVNAVDAMPSGGEITFTTGCVTAEEISDLRDNTSQGEYVFMRVSDTGVGIAKETLEHIFEPFFTTKDISSGTGLGLSSAYGIIERHNGLIRVKSQVDRGTEFSVYIPAVKEDAPAKQVKQQTTVSGREMILFVDDDEVLQELGGEILNSLDYLPLIAKNGIEAIQQYKKNQDTIKLVILDMIMPKMSGAEIYNKLVEINPDVKVLLSSGYSIDGQASDIISRGCNGFIQKPFNRNELADKIKEILETTDK